MKKFLRALAGEAQAVPPIWLMRQAGRYLPEYRETRKLAKNFLHFCYTPDLAVEVTHQPIRRYGFDAAIMFSDILVIPDALGQEVAFKEGVGPVLAAFEREEDFKVLDKSRVVDHLSPVFDILGRLRKELPEETALIGFAGAPWTIAYYMIEGGSGKNGEKLKRWAYRDPESFGKLIRIIEDATITYLDHQVQAGAEALQLFESWAGIASEPLFRDWVIKPMQRIADGVRAKHPNIPILGFPRLGGALIPDYVQATNVNAVSLDPQVPLAWARDVLQPKCTVQGNLDNALLVTGGEAMTQQIDSICDIFCQGPFIFNLGHGIVPETPPDHVAELVERVRARG